MSDTIEKIEIKQRVFEFDNQRLMGNLENVIPYLQSFNDNNTTYYRYELQNEYYYEDNGNHGNVNLFGYRFETDKEYKKRLKTIENAQKEKIIHLEKHLKKTKTKQEKEIELLKKLQKKYGDGLPG